MVHSDCARLHSSIQFHGWTVLQAGSTATRAGWCLLSCAPWTCFTKDIGQALSCGSNLSTLALLTFWGWLARCCGVTFSGFLGLLGAHSTHIPTP